MTDKEQILAIIKQYADKGERLLEDAYKNDECASTTGYWDGYKDCADGLLRELEDIQEEPKKCMYSKGDYTDEDRKALCEGCEEECEFNKKKEPASDDLEEAANNAVIALVPSFGQKYSDGSYVSSCRDCFKREELLELFKAGAKWQKQKDESKVLTEEQCRKIRDDAFELGKDAMKQQMMAKAVDGHATFEFDGFDDKTYGYIAHDPICFDDMGLKDTNKVKLIVIKEG